MRPGYRWGTSGPSSLCCGKTGGPSNHGFLEKGTWSWEGTKACYYGPLPLLPFGSLLGAALHWEPPLVSVLPSWLTSAQSWQGLKALRILGLNLSPIPIVTVSKLFNPFSFDFFHGLMGYINVCCFISKHK